MTWYKEENKAVEAVNYTRLLAVRKTWYKDENNTVEAVK